MVAAPKKNKSIAPVPVDAEHQAMLVVLADTYGTYVNTVHKAIEALWKQDKGNVRPPASVQSRE